MDYSKIITIEPGKRSGKPCIRGLRITVYDVLDYLAGGMTEAQILEDFPALTETDIRGCLAFAADNQIAVVRKEPGELSDITFEDYRQGLANLTKIW